MSLPVDEWIDGQWHCDDFAEEIPAPSVGIFDSPLAIIAVNVGWRSHVLGALERLLWRGAWAGDDEDKDHAIQQILELYTAIAKGDDVFSDYVMFADYIQPGLGPIMPSGTIPSTHRDLEIIITGRSAVAAANDGLLVQFSSNTNSTDYQSWMFSRYGAAGNDNVEFIQTIPGLRLGTVPAASSNAIANMHAKIVVANYASALPKYAMSQAVHEQGEPINARVHVRGSGRYSNPIGGGNYDPVFAVSARLTSGANWLPGSTMRVYGVGRTP